MKEISIDRVSSCLASRVAAAAANVLRGGWVDNLSYLGGGWTIYCLIAPEEIRKSNHSLSDNRPTDTLLLLLLLLFCISVLILERGRMTFRISPPPPPRHKTTDDSVEIAFGQNSNIYCWWLDSLSLSLSRAL